MTMTREQRNKRRTENRFATHNNHYRNAMASITNAFQRAEREHWTHKMLLAWRDRWLFTPVYQTWPSWIKERLQGVWDVCDGQLWAKLVVCYLHPDKGILMKLSDLQESVDLSRLDMATCHMCFNDNDVLYPFTGE